MESTEPKQLVNEGGIAQTHAKNIAGQVDLHLNMLMAHMMSGATAAETKRSALARLHVLANLTRAQFGLPELVEPEG